MDIDILTIERTAEILEVNPRFVRDSISKGNLKAHRVGSRTYILRSDLINFIKSGEDAKEAGKRNATKKGESNDDE